jgi:PIN domain nuclease of toxin-antitoxin system
VELLLDTHIWLWMLSAPERLNAKTQTVLTDPGVELWLSVASPWEVGIKHARGKLQLTRSLGSLVGVSAERFGMKLRTIELEHALTAAALPPHHSDPFDRLFVAQAQLEGMTLATADRMITQYDVPVLWAS